MPELLPSQDCAAASASASVAGAAPVAPAAEFPKIHGLELELARHKSLEVAELEAGKLAHCF